MMKKLEKLTAEQEAMIPVILDQFLSIGLSTQPANFEAAERAINDAYQVVGLDPPKLFIRLASPNEGALGAAMLEGAKYGNQVRDQVWTNVSDQVRDQIKEQVRDQIKEQVWDQVRDQVWDQVRDQVREQVGEQVRNQVWGQVRNQVRDQIKEQVWDQVRNQVWDQVREQVWGQVWGQVWDQVRDQIKEQVWDQVWTAYYSQHEASWLSFLNFFGANVKESKKIEPLTRIAKNCGWCWFFKNAAIITDRPLKLSFDDAKRLHSETGPSVEYRDGFKVYSWHGVRVPGHWIEQRKTLDPNEVIKVENVEQRAAGAAIIGWPKMLSVLESKVIDDSGNNDIGQLIELKLPGLDEPGRFLKAHCPRNGMIVEGVPRISDIDALPIETAIAAQAWRIGDPQSEYTHPPKRT